MRVTSVALCLAMCACGAPGGPSHSNATVVVEPTPWTPGHDPYPPESTPDASPPKVASDGATDWQPFSHEVMDQAARMRRPVLLRVDAQWDATGRAVFVLAVDVPAVREALRATAILALHADFTHEDERVRALLRKLGTETIPLYLIMLPDGTRQALPQPVGMTSAQLVDALHAASEAYPPAGFGPAAP